MCCQAANCLPLVVLDDGARLLPGVLSSPSHQTDSFSDGLLEGPQCTAAPRCSTCSTSAGPCPGPVVSHHAEIARWRREALHLLLAPADLIAKARAEGLLDAADEACCAPSAYNLQLFDPLRPHDKHKRACTIAWRPKWT
jgi:tRNA G37 N-methylase TrmD